MDAQAGGGGKRRQSKILERLRSQQGGRMLPSADSESSEGISDRRRALQERRQKGLTEAARRAEVIAEEEDDEDDSHQEHADEAAQMLGTSDLDASRHGEGGGADSQQPHRRVNPRANNIVTYENIEDLVTDPEQHGITRIDHPVHVFPLELMPPEILDRSTGKKIKLAENTIQPLLYMDRMEEDESTLILCDCDCGCPEWCTVMFPALVAGFTACTHVIPDTVNAVCGADCLPAMPACECCEVPNCSNVDCMALASSCLPLEQIANCGGCVTGVGESVAACGAAVVGGVTDCAGTAAACANGVVDGVTNCATNTATAATNCYESIPPCNIHNILLQELYSCYYQVTRGCC